MSFASRFSVGCAAACWGIARPAVAAKHVARNTVATAPANLFESLFIAHSPNAKIPDGFTPTARLRCGGVSWRLDGLRDGAVSQTGRRAREPRQTRVGSPNFRAMDTPDSRAQMEAQPATQMRNLGNIYRLRQLPACTAG